MMTSNEFKDYLKQMLPQTTVYNGTINRNDTQCIGVFVQGSGFPHIAIGGRQNTSYDELPITILIHWTESTEECNVKANEIYEMLIGANNVYINSRRIIYFQMLTPCPVDISRDANNIVEMVIRLKIIYER